MGKMYVKKRGEGKDNLRPVITRGDSQSLGGMTADKFVTKEDMNKFDKKSSTVDVTLSASKWSDNLYTINVIGVTNISNQEVLPALSITPEELDALQGANIQDGGQSKDTIILKAFGEIPTIDVPIRIVLRGDI